MGVVLRLRLKLGLGQGRKGLPNALSLWTSSQRQGCVIDQLVFFIWLKCDLQSWCLSCSLPEDIRASSGSSTESGLKVSCMWTHPPSQTTVKKIKLATTITSRGKSEGQLNYSNKAKDVMDSGSAPLWAEYRAAQFVNGCHQTCKGKKNSKVWKNNSVLIGLLILDCRCLI